MAKPAKITPNKNQPIEIDGDQTDWLLDKGRTLAIDKTIKTIGLTIENSFDLDLTIAGKITMKGSTGHIGLLVEGESDQTVNNDGGAVVVGRTGSITSSGIGIRMTDKAYATDFFIRGKVSGDDAALVLNGRADVVIGAAAILSSKDGTIRIEDGGNFTTITNRGLIEATNVGGNAILVDSANIAFTNIGTVKGNILAGSGNDTFDLTRGTLDGTVTGGSGKNTYIIEEQATLAKIKVTDGADERIESHSTITLAGTKGFANVTLVGTKAIDATGSDYGEYFNGNDLANKLDGGAGDDIIIAFDGNDTLIGGLGDDGLEGRSGNDLLDGGDGDDGLLGGAGEDILIGGAGDDGLNGSYGEMIDGTRSLAANTLTGGAGADVFNFGTPDTDVLLTAVTDTITDFNGTESDRLYFSENGFPSGNNNNYFEEAVAYADLATLLTAADTKLDGTYKYFLGQVGSDSYLVADADGNGFSEIVKLTGVAVTAFDFTFIIN